MKTTQFMNERLPAVALGCLSMHPFYAEPPSEAESIAVIHLARELGVTMLDTSDVYADGENESLIGRAIKGVRDRYFLASKFGSFTNAQGKIVLNGRPEYVRQACEASLRRLGTEVLDLYYLHRVDPAVPIEDTVGAMGDLVAAGKVRYLGLSEVSTSTLRRAHGVHPIAALQTEYSLWTRDVEKEILGVCEALGVCFVAYAVLGRGFLTGGISSFNDLGADDRRRTLPRFQPDNLEANLRLVRELKTMAEQLNSTPAQVATSWVIERGGRKIALVGTARLKRIEENAAAGTLALPPEMMDRLDVLFDPGAIAGARYTPGQMERIQT